MCSKDPEWWGWLSGVCAYRWRLVAGCTPVYRSFLSLPPLAAALAALRYAISSRTLRGLLAARVCSYLQQQQQQQTTHSRSQHCSCLTLHQELQVHRLLRPAGKHTSLPHTPLCCHVQPAASVAAWLHRPRLAAIDAGCEPVERQLSPWTSLSGSAWFALLLVNLWVWPRPNSVSVCWDRGRMAREEWVCRLRVVSCLPSIHRPGGSGSGLDSKSILLGNRKAPGPCNTLQSQH